MKSFKKLTKQLDEATYTLSTRYDDGSFAHEHFSAGSDKDAKNKFAKAIGVSISDIGVNQKKKDYQKSAIAIEGDRMLSKGRIGKENKNRRREISESEDDGSLDGLVESLHEATRKKAHKHK